ncbi:hypothetical protein BN59_00838 [Legionella massiliensis]|uniref:Uncharacterized protein n=1 Tax=Legionella massiliensis TaxID=1034943 RepID=A0A078KXT3_9GAMM|nr:hypothetical protein BN59_00838 [Legionella massiliensis]CEE12302.1 hypothetical protein BN1094_00838 [Legionella massiliensis]
MLPRSDYKTNSLLSKLIFIRLSLTLTAIEQSLGLLCCGYGLSPSRSNRSRDDVNLRNNTPGSKTICPLAPWGEN